jgi:Flp pilus assembly protein TadD
VFKAVTCEFCGAKFRADRNRCPRCRRIIIGVDPVAAAASSRRMTKVAAGLGGAFLLVLGALWLTSDPEPAAPAGAKPATAPVASVRMTGVPPRSPSEPGGAFLDSSGAATLAYQAGDYQSALAQFQDAIARNPNDAESLSNLGQVFVKLGRTEEALAPLQRATALNPDRWAYRFNLARALGLLERWEESIASYRQAQRLFPDDYVTTFNLAMTLHKSGDEGGAVTAYLRAIELNPEDPTFRKALGISYERLRKPSEAVSAYSEYLRLSPGSADAEQVRARIALLNGAASPPAGGASPGASHE